MRDLFSDCLLLAEHSRWSHLSEPFKREATSLDRGELARALSILTVIIVLAWLLSRLWAAQDRHRAQDRPWRLFFALCKAHQLPWSSCWLLLRLARARRLKQPARLFVEPQWFEAAGLGPAWRRRAARLIRIRDGLFAAPPPRARQAAEPTRPASKQPGAASVLRPESPGVTLDIPPWPVSSPPSAPAPDAR